MKRGLVVVEDLDSHRELLAEAGDWAEGVGGELVVLSFMTEAEYEQNAETLEAVGETERTTYGPDAAITAGQRFLDEMVDEVLGDTSVESEHILNVADENEQATQIVQTAIETSCDHVFLLGRRRSPTGKAVFGDTAQSVILNFDGFVTVATE